MEKAAQPPAMLIDITTEFDGWSTAPDLENLIKTAARAAVLAKAEEFTTRAELSILLTSDAAVAKLNSQYRGLNKATNVLSFCGESATGPESRSFLLGDVVLAYQTIAAEAQQQRIGFSAHVSHLVVHGVLHLLSYDHENDTSAHIMELAEIKILEGIGVENPYAQAHSNVMIGSR